MMLHTFSMFMPTLDWSQGFNLQNIEKKRKRKKGKRTHQEKGIDERRVVVVTFFLF